ncbi:Cytochrome P450 4C1 [Halotydeus destructor]|nr:Cytochrome P450 4C1 [Halotydeus destructor]
MEIRQVHQSNTWSSVFQPSRNVGIVLTGMKQGLEAGEALFQCMIGFGRLEEFRKSGLSRVWLGPMPAVVLSSPEAVEVLLSSNKLIDKAMFYDYMHTWLGTGLLTSRGLKWRSHRKMLTPSFHFRILEDFVPVMRKETQIFVRVLENIRASNAQGMVSDIAKPILMCALDTICETAMGSKVNAQSEPDNKYVKNVHEAGLAFMDRLMNPLLLSEHIYSVTLQGRRYKNQLAVLHEFTNAAIRGKKEQMMKEMANGTFEEKKCMVFMDTLIYQHLKDPKSLTMENIREEVDTFMFEGHDTTAWAVTWCTYLIGLDELVQEKLHQELDSAFDGDKDGNFTMEQLRGLTYTECCVKEALRLFPSVPLIGRQTALDTDFCGYMVPAGTTVYILFHFAKWLNLVRRVRKIPGPPSLPLLGHLGAIFNKVRNGCYVDEAVILFVKEAAESKELKDVPLFHIFLGSVINVGTTTPEGAEAILSNSTLIDKAVQYDFLHSWLGTGLLTSNGAKWRSRRKMLTQSFHFRILEDFLPIMSKNTSILSTSLHEKSLSNSEHIIADISEPILLCALDSICETAMGVSVHAQSEPDNEYVRSIHVAGQAFMARFVNPLLIMDAIFNLTSIGRKYTKSLKTMHDFTDDTIKKRKEQLEYEMNAGIFKEEKCMTFMDTLICQHLRDGQSLTMKNIREEVDTFMFEGHDTTAWAVTWCTYLIGLDEGVQDRLHQELDKAFGGHQDSKFTMEQLKELSYTERCVKEALRLFPSVPMLARQAMVDTQLCGHLVPAGTQVAVFPYAVHRNERYWPNPEIFDPDRFLSEACRKRHPFAYVPFSAGPRNCIGMKFAMLEAKSMVASIFRTFKVTSLLPRDKVRISPSLILRSHLPIPVKLEKRI